MIAKTNADISKREREVLVLIAEGKTGKEIASALGISVKTVEKHRQSLMDKTHLHGIALLTRWAIGLGLVKPL